MIACHSVQKDTREQEIADAREERGQQNALYMCAFQF